MLTSVDLVAIGNWYLCWRGVEPIVYTIPRLLFHVNKLFHLYDASLAGHCHKEVRIACTTTHGTHPLNGHLTDRTDGLTLMVPDWNVEHIR
jgi:hypothetical protein